MSSTLTQMIVIVSFAGAVLLLAVLMRVLTTNQRRRGLPAGFMKLYGFVALGGFALLLVALDVEPEDQGIKIAAFTLLGIVAGYLAGSPDADRKEETTDPLPADDDAREDKAPAEVAAK
ncbi:hypothetical protein ACFO5K_22770 [Nocardia halotolerans]|uniref:Uncharacterized protein n=1 Tax=Nocardia halotolerans TaxID=1755878 RepID=A0ABV8VNQ6_9NOCA